MSERPSFQFYPADWRSNANLRRCSHAARGAWMDVLCVLHERAEYGIARWPLAELANAAGVPMKLMLELVAKDVLKGSDTKVTTPLIYTPRSGRKTGPDVTLVPEQDGPIWFSSRMVKDEYVRTHRGISTRFGANENDEDQSPTRAPTQRQGDGSSSSSPSASAGSPLPSPSPIENKNLNSHFHAGNGSGNGAHSVTIEDPNERMARFQAKLAAHLGANGWDIVIAATQPTSPEHSRALSLCKQAARALGKGWPKQWPIAA